jgi:HSP20 family protein
MALRRWRPGWRLRRWEPFRELEEEMQRLFEEWPFGRVSPWSRRALAAREWTPRVDMFDSEDKVVINAEIPGMSKEDVDISVTGDILTIQGERKAEEEVKDEDYYCCEQHRGAFYRVIQLPSGLETDNIDATYDNGILEITLPKSPEVKPKRIEVKVK